MGSSAAATQPLARAGRSHAHAILCSGGAGTGQPRELLWGSRAQRPPSRDAARRGDSWTLLTTSWRERRPHLQGILATHRTRSDAGDIPGTQRRLGERPETAPYLVREPRHREPPRAGTAPPSSPAAGQPHGAPPFPLPCSAPGTWLGRGPVPPLAPCLAEVCRKPAQHPGAECGGGSILPQQTTARPGGSGTPGADGGGPRSGTTPRALRVPAVLREQLKALRDLAVPHCIALGTPRMRVLWEPRCTAPNIPTFQRPGLGSTGRVGSPQALGAPWSERAPREAPSSSTIFWG